MRNNNCVTKKERTHNKADSKTRKSWPPSPTRSAMINAAHLFARAGCAARDHFKESGRALFFFAQLGQRGNPAPINYPRESLLVGRRRNAPAVTPPTRVAGAEPTDRRQREIGQEIGGNLSCHICNVYLTSKKPFLHRKACCLRRFVPENDRKTRA